MAKKWYKRNPLFDVEVARTVVELQRFTLDERRRALFAEVIRSAMVDATAVPIRKGASDDNSRIHVSEVRSAHEFLFSPDLKEERDVIFGYTSFSLTAARRVVKQFSFVKEWRNLSRIPRVEHQNKAVRRSLEGAEILLMDLIKSEVQPKPLDETRHRFVDMARARLDYLAIRQIASRQLASHIIAYLYRRSTPDIGKLWTDRWEREE